MLQKADCPVSNECPVNYTQKAGAKCANATCLTEDDSTKLKGDDITNCCVRPSGHYGIV